MIAMEYEIRVYFIKQFSAEREQQVIIFHSSAKQKNNY